MNSVHSLQKGQACAFDFIQNVVSIVTSELEKNQRNNRIEMEKCNHFSTCFGKNI